jgi:DNA-binding NarL/FixJ family response regulator
MIRTLIADDQQMVRAGFRMIIDSQADMEVVGEASDGAEAVSLAPPLPDPLTGRELDVVRLVARGRTNEEIAGGLFVSRSTVKTHLGSVQRKLGARNRVEIAAWAWESGVVGGT